MYMCIKICIQAHPFMYVNVCLCVCLCGCMFESCDCACVDVSVFMCTGMYMIVKGGDIMGSMLYIPSHASNIDRYTHRHIYTHTYNTDKHTEILF